MAIAFDSLGVYTIVANIFTLKFQNVLQIALDYIDKRVLKFQNVLNPFNWTVRRMKYYYIILKNYMTFADEAHVYERSESY